MRLQIAQRSGVCSTLVISNFPGWGSDEVMSAKFIRCIYAHENPLSSEPMTSVSVDYTGKTTLNRRHPLDCYKVKNFAFFMTTDYSKPSFFKTWALKHGFKESEAIHNTKNGTTVVMLFARVKDVLEALDYDFKKEAFKGWPEDKVHSLSGDVISPVQY